MGQAAPFRTIALVVEDDELQRTVAATLLEEQDISVIQCESAEAAELVVRKFGAAISLVVTDVNLAGTMTGTELAASITRSYPGIPIVITSGRPVNEIPDGAVFMPKPWLPLDILRHAEQACQR